jgi:hypothetical protein
MRRNRTIEWMGLALIVAIGIVAAIYVSVAPLHRLGMALRATARWSFLWFCLATYGGALATLFGPRFLPLARNARDLALAFASAHLVHVALVMFWVYLLAVISLSGTLLRTAASLKRRSRPQNTVGALPS